MPITRRAALALPVLTAPRLAWAAFPDRPVRLVIPYSAGGSTDTALRALADAMGRQLGQSVVPENRAGGGGILGAQMLATARPDGYLLAQMPVSVFRHPHLMARPAFDPLTDFTWVVQVAAYLFGLVVRADSPHTSLAALVEAARRAPGRITYATTGVGSSMHITMEAVAQAAGLEWTHVPFRGTAEATAALLGGQITAIAASDWSRAVREGVMRLLFTTGAARTRSFPEAPTLRELGYGLVVTSPYGLAGPRGLAPEVTRTLHDATRAALDDPAYLAVLERLDMGVEYLGSEAYAASARAQVEAEAEVVRRFNLRQG